VRQQFDRPRVEDVARTVERELESLNLGEIIRPGQTVALTAGSRGIANIPLVLRATAQFLLRMGAKPFLVPAMGSHGGGTAEGQRKIIESYGITEEYVGVPIRASMDVISLGTTEDGIPVYLDRIASEADHIGVVARIKPHTSYHGPIESGLLKMMMIGLGKHVGALAYHKILLEQPYDRIVRAVSKVMRARAPIAFGLGLIENAYDETAIVAGVRPADFERREEELLVHARDWLPQLPYRNLDLLIIDQIGKNISGSGMDTNVVGRKRTLAGKDIAEMPAMRLIFVRGLTPQTHGNATGIGLADFTTKRLVDSMNYRATTINCLTAGYPSGANIPVYFDTDREVLDAALAILGTREAQDARVVRIKHTLDVEEVEMSEPCLQEKGRPLTVQGSAYSVAFDQSGNLPPLGNGH